MEMESRQNFTDIYGFDPESLLRNPKEVWARLQAILSDKVLRFNPYLTDDGTLLACAERARWLPFPSLTQMTVFHFHHIRKVEWEYPYEAISYSIGNDVRELLMPLSSLTDKVTYTASRRQIHVTINGRPLTNSNMVEHIQGRDYFVSHALMAHKRDGRMAPAYRMFRLKGDQSQKASTIRTKMIESKVSMLNEILAYPHSPDYLQCSRDFIEYAAPISAAIAAILGFPEVNP